MRRQRVGELHVGSLLMFGGRPCKCVVEPTRVRKRKHAKGDVRIFAVDLFTGVEYEGALPASQHVDVPVVEWTRYKLLAADRETGKVSVLLENGNTKDDLCLPYIEGTEEEFEIPNAGHNMITTYEILEGLSDGMGMSVLVLAVLGKEQILTARPVHEGELLPRPS